jgi:transposase-like protein
MQRRSEEYWRRVIGKQARSGKSAARYCREHELQRGTFLRWRRRLGADRLSECALEPPRVCRRSNSVRGYGHGQKNEVLN